MKWAVLALLLCSCLSPLDNCGTETRYVARVRAWNVVCLERQADGLQTCAVWPIPPQAPEWVGDPVAQADSGYPLRAVLVCKDIRITDTPI